MTEERKTINTPVSKEELAKFRELAETRQRFSERYVDLDLEKIRVMAAIRRLDNEKSALFESILVERGVSPTTAVEIDPETGEIQVDFASAQALEGVPEGVSQESAPSD